MFEIKFCESCEEREAVKVFYNGRRYCMVCFREMMFARAE